jgi:hypothetical protein
MKMKMKNSSSASSLKGLSGGSNNAAGHGDKKSFLKRVTPGGSCLGFAKGLATGVVGMVVLPVAGACVLRASREGMHQHPQSYLKCSQGKALGPRDETVGGHSRNRSRDRTRRNSNINKRKDDGGDRGKLDC